MHLEKVTPKQQRMAVDGQRSASSSPANRLGPEHRANQKSHRLLQSTPPQCNLVSTA